VLPFDSSWSFTKSADTSGEPQGANAAEFDDSQWRVVNTPHDWSIEGPYDENNPVGRGGGYLPSGVGWYRKTFMLPAGDVGRRVYVDFDGIMANSTVWINGFQLGNRPYGYVGLHYDLTGHLQFGPAAITGENPIAIRAPGQNWDAFKNESNILSVRVDDTTQPASRYYTGAGIYRHARLVITGPVHVAHWGIFVTTPHVAPEQASVRVETVVTNDSDQPSTVAVRSTLLGPQGDAVASETGAPQTIPAGQDATFDQDLAVANPALWDTDHPNLYHAVASVIAEDKKTVDRDAVTFGIRTSEFRADTGYWLNGKNIKIKGVCLHQDGGAVGEAVPDAVWEYRLRALKGLGTNAIRWAHNPPSPAILDLCDRLGLLVMDEMFDAWTVAKPSAENGYNRYFTQWSKTDLRDTVLRDRNHPSVILYSAGNEIHDTPNAEKAKAILAGLMPLFHQYDPTRPVTMALLRPNVSHDYDDGLADMLDVIGTNYRNPELLDAHDAKPTRKIINTEEHFDARSWLLVRDNPPLSGQFLWAGIDYLGEANWPAVNSAEGLLDRMGQPKGEALQRRSWWVPDQPMVGLARLEEAPAGPNGRRVQVGILDWNPADPTTQTVVAYTTAPQVELFLNGKSLGVQNAELGNPPTWTVAYEPGELKAVAMNNGQTVATDSLVSAGAPAKIMLTLDNPDSSLVAGDFDHVALVTATILDQNGVRCATADDLVTFTVDGPGTIVAVDNADRTSHESFQGSQRHAYRGRCLVILRATAPNAPISLTATANGLQTGTLTLHAAAPAGNGT
jgi:beta-galactosidase